MSFSMSRGGDCYLNFNMQSVSKVVATPASFRCRVAHKYYKNLRWFSTPFHLTKKTKIGGHHLKAKIKGVSSRLYFSMVTYYAIRIAIVSSPKIFWYWSVNVKLLKKHWKLLPATFKRKRQVIHQSKMDTTHLFYFFVLSARTGPLPMLGPSALRGQQYLLGLRVTRVQKGQRNACEERR